MLPSNLENLAESHLQELCDDKCPESQSLDFKQVLPSTSSDDKLELLKDVCAFANADGGDLIYGVAEASGAAAKLIPLNGEAPDAAKRRITQVLDGIEPRLQGVRVHPIAVTGGFALVVRVPASFDGPHSSRVNHLRRFVMRNGTGTTDMSFDQIRTAFDRTATLAERARGFIEQRLHAVELRQTWKPFVPGPICVVVIVPVAGLARRMSVDIAALNNNYNRFMFKEWRSVSRTMNLDGLVVYPNAAKEGARAYTQVFRSGAMEALRAGGATVGEGDLIPSTSVTTFYREAIIKFIAASRDLGFVGPAVVRCALMHTSGYRFAVGGDPIGHSIANTDRSNLALPDTWIDAIEELDSEAKVDNIVQPMMDVLWQAFDLERCVEYNLAGSWQPRK